MNQSFISKVGRFVSKRRSSQSLPSQRRARRARPTVYAFLALLTLTLTSVSHANEFHGGVDFYEKGNYEQALKYFEGSLSSGETAAARHNLALTYFQLGQPAEAAWQIERALRIDPLKTEYHYKLGALRQQLGLFEHEPEWYQIAAQLLTTKIWIALATTSFWLLLAALFLPRIGGLQINIGIKAIRLISLLALLLSAPALWLNYQMQAIGIVVNEEATELHAAPASAAHTSGIARPGERAQILDQHNDFYQVKTESQITGWIAKDSFRALSQ
ncbi:MAG: tetratricopeptide repeat protein [Opitutales bacterium]|jgi:tetratricopeptide (TPR) repeat protein|nr:tetratricopeptide repeat protein [Opitutales bacterium]MDP4777439.1 tetratricopeptide repeat protein [Opitutales bacterium]